MIPLEIDPPDHRKYRAILDPMFSPKAIARLEGNIRELANDLIDEFIDKGGMRVHDGRSDRPLPVFVFLDLMGLPQDMRDTFVGWAMGLLHAQDREDRGEVHARNLRLSADGDQGEDRKSPTAASSAPSCTAGGR